MLDSNGTWVLLAPISGLTITNDVGGEFRVDKVTFVSPTKLPRIRRRFGIPRTIADLKKSTLFFRESQPTASCFATHRLTGRGAEIEADLLSAVRDELSILALSQLAYDRRASNAHPALSEEYRSGRLEFMLFNTTHATSLHTARLMGKISELVIDARWRKFQDQMFFSRLLRMIRGDCAISKGWRRDLRNASILAGQSQMSSDLPQCFLWNMIAIELLLCRPGDIFSNALPARVEAFIGWTTSWEQEGYAVRIADAYSKRCGLVHSGDREAIKLDDLLFTDSILINVLYNIARHSEIFTCKDDLVEFSKKVEAERILGLRPRIRPKTMTFTRTNYGPRDLERI